MNTEQTIEEKIKKLKKIHSKWHPDARTLISDWEEKLIRLQAKAEWLKHPNTVELRQIAMEQVDLINDILANKEDLVESERKTMFAMKKAHQVYLAVLISNPENEIKGIEQSVDAELINNSDE